MTDDFPLTYLRIPDTGDGFDVYRCENGSQAWNVAEGISESSARVIAALLAGEILEKEIGRAEARYARNCRDLDTSVEGWAELHKVMLENRDYQIHQLEGRAFTSPDKVPVLD